MFDTVGTIPGTWKVEVGIHIFWCPSKERAFPSIHGHFSCIDNISVHRVEVMVHEKGADDVADSDSASISKREVGMGRRWHQTMRMMNDAAILHSIVIYTMWRGGVWILARWGLYRCGS
jgi:hypothetical protein